MNLKTLIEFFESPNSLSLILHLISAMSIPIHGFGFYILIFHSPETMKKVKYYLLNLHFWTVLFDYSIGILTIPMILFPEFAGYPLGFVRLFDVKLSWCPIFVVPSSGGYSIGVATIPRSSHPVDNNGHCVDNVICRVLYNRSV
ncbi:hypothetical protein B9Z55_017478 [Caenorhabditis nigoni]|uniref:Uncharacterized protein n=1 Tax=Caenorhabditis nigoni TaxID=1611254 RepID=A0A2G5T9W8_9PELO|nr:hypothetical protein B9Z55_017478 [Caenorhabditis nigoni]